MSLTSAMELRYCCMVARVHSKLAKLGISRRGFSSLHLFVFAISIGGGMLNLSLPLFAHSLGATFTEIGLLGASYGVVYLSSALPAGKFSDRVGHRMSAVVGTVVLVFVVMAYLTANNVFQLIILRGLEAIGWVLIYISIDTLSVETPHLSQSTKGAGLMLASFGFGSTIGVIVGGVALSYFGFSAGFILSLIALSIGAPVAYFKIRSLQELHHNRYSADKISPLRLVPFLCLAFTVFYILGIVIYIPPVFAESLRLSKIAIGLSLGLFYATRIISSLSSQWICDSSGKAKAVNYGLVSGILAALLIATQPPRITLFIAMPLMAATLGIIFPIMISSITSIVPKLKRGEALGFLELSCTAGIMAASFVGGILSDAFSPQIAFLACFSLLLFVLLLFNTYPASKRIMRMYH